MKFLFIGSIYVFIYCRTNGGAALCTYRLQDGRAVYYVPPVAGWQQPYAGFGFLREPDPDNMAW